ncbi:MAG: hemolysin family protein [Alphaproteobacteria bacterium]
MSADSGTSKANGAEGRARPSMVRAVADWVRGRRHRKAEEPSLRETVEEIIEDFKEPTTSEELDERRLLRNVLKLGELSAEDVMVPRADIIAVEASTPLDELVKSIAAEAHSRLPVYRERLDDVIGMIHIKDVLRYWGRDAEFSLGQILRDVLFVAPSMRVLDLLLEMRESRTHIALVVDEYGGIDGLVTIEDVVEEIVGEIEDEHDEDGGPRIVRRGDGTYLADGRLTLEEFESATAPALTDNDRAQIDTLGGLVVALAGRVPGRGEVIKHGSGIEFEVLEADARRVKRVRVRGVKPLPADESTSTASQAES